MSKKILSFDFETVGLDGIAWAAGAVVYENGKETARFQARTSYPKSFEDMSDWEKTNVPPVLEQMEETHDSSEKMLADFAEFYKAHKNGAFVIAESGFTVEGGQFRRMRDSGVIGTWDGPYLEHQRPDGETITLYDVQDVSGFLLGRELNASTSAYIKKYEIDLGDVPGTAHHPVYDCIVAAKSFEHAAKRAGLTD